MIFIISTLLGRIYLQVVQALLTKGENIEEPHSNGCKCLTCTQQGMDELRQAKTKLTTFKALASDSYIVLASKDPVFVAFELAQKLNKLAIEDKHFKVGPCFVRLIEKKKFYHISNMSNIWSVFWSSEGVHVWIRIMNY